MPRDRRSRAARLLDDAIAHGHLSVEALVLELRASAAFIESVRRGDVSMPLERQLYLAVLVQRRAPDLRREAAALQGQVIAAMAMRARETVCHDSPPVQARIWP